MSLYRAERFLGPKVNNWSHGRGTWVSARFEIRLHHDGLTSHCFYFAQLRDCPGIACKCSGLLTLVPFPLIFCQGHEDNIHDNGTVQESSNVYLSDRRFGNND
jgi:hypothetical protein